MNILPPFKSKQKHWPLSPTDQESIQDVNHQIYILSKQLYELKGTALSSQEADLSISLKNFNKCCGSLKEIILKITLEADCPNEILEWRKLV